MAKDVNLQTLAAPIGFIPFKGDNGKKEESFCGTLFLTFCLNLRFSKFLDESISLCHS